MKLLVLADVHGARWKAGDMIQEVAPDLIIVPGDLPSSFDIPVFAISMIRGGNRRSYIKNAYQRFLDRLTYRQIRTAKRLLLSIEKFHIPVLIIHGNTETRETREWLRLFCHRYPNFYWLADSSLMVGGYQFIGHGWVSYDQKYNRIPSPGEITEKEAKSILLNTIGNSRRKVKKNILISHAPPFGTPLDYVPQKRDHAGSKSVREIMDSGIIKGVISGHIHESRGVYRNPKNWWAINAGSVIDDVACLIDLKASKVTWYNHVVNSVGISPIIYRNRTKYKYDN